MNTSVPTKLDFVSLQVKDLSKSKKFYVEVLEFETGESPNPDAVIFKDAGGAIFAVRKPLIDLSSVLNVDSGISLWFAVSDVEKLHEQVIKSGEKVISPPSDGPFGKMMVIFDPDRYQITLHEYER